MSDWKTFCQNFNTYQDTNKSYPNSCPTDSTFKNKSVKEIARLVAEIGALKGALENQSDSWREANIGWLSLYLKDRTFQFCCAYEAKLKLNTDYQQILQDYGTAKARIESVRNPAGDLQDKGTTFPFGKPLRSDSVPFLIAFSIVFLIIGLGLLLQVGNIKLAYSAPPSYGPSIIDILYEQFQQTSYVVFLITVLGSFAAAGGIYYAILKTKPEWFGMK